MAGGTPHVGGPAAFRASPPAAGPPPLPPSPHQGVVRSAPLSTTRTPCLLSKLTTKPRATHSRRARAMPTRDPTASGWRLVGPVAELGPGWVLYKKPRPAPTHHVDRLFVSAEGRRYNSLAAAQRAALLVEELSVCTVCGSGDCEPLNDIVLCDGERCGRAFHQRCLPEPLISIPVGEWLCPGCCGDEAFNVAVGVGVGGSGGSGGAAAAQSRWPLPPRAAAPLSECAEKRRSLYSLDAASLRPACTARGCGGEARHAPADGDATVFECERCGMRLRSKWWAQRLAGAKCGLVASAPASSADASPAPAPAEVPASALPPPSPPPLAPAPQLATAAASTSVAVAACGGCRGAVDEPRAAAVPPASELPTPPGLLKRRARDLAALDTYFTDGPAAGSRGFGPPPESPRRRSRLTPSSTPQPRTSPF